MQQTSRPTRSRLKLLKLHVLLTLYSSRHRALPECWMLRERQRPSVFLNEWRRLISWLGHPGTLVRAEYITGYHQNDQAQPRGMVRWPSATWPESAQHLTTSVPRSTFVLPCEGLSGTKSQSAKPYPKLVEGELSLHPLLCFPIASKELNDERGGWELLLLRLLDNLCPCLWDMGRFTSVTAPRRERLGK